MDVLEHLTDEHRTAEQLMATLADSEPGAERDRTLDELEEALTTHMAVEERFVYPLARQVVGEEDEQGAENEHDLARDGLATLRRLKDEPGFGAAVEMLQGGIGHHVQEEENEIFPQLREQAADELAALGSPEELESQVRAGGSGEGAADEGPTKAELYEQAKDQGVEGRSTMSKDELARAVEQP